MHPSMMEKPKKRRPGGPYAAKFNGVDQWLTAARPVGLNPLNNSYLFAVWYRPIVINDQLATLFSITSDGSELVTLDLWYYNRPQIVWQDAMASNLFSGLSSITLEPFDWALIVGYWDASVSEGGISIDGREFETQVSQPPNGQSVLGGNDITVGGMALGEGSFGQLLQGRLQDLVVCINPTASWATIRDRLWHNGAGIPYSALTTLEKTQFGLFEWWPLNEKSGNRVGVHNSTSLSAAGDPRIGSGHPKATSDAARLAVNLNGVSNYLSRARGTELDLSSKSCWIAGRTLKNANADPGELAVITTSGGTPYVMDVYVDGAERLFFNWSDGTDNPTARQGIIPPDFDANNWHFWIGFWDNDTKTIGLSLDGSDFDLDTDENYPDMPVGGDTLYIGTYPPSAAGGPACRQQDIAIGAPPALSMTELAPIIRDRLYNNGGPNVDYSDLTPQELTDWGLIEWWRLDEIDGNRAGAHGGLTLTAQGNPLPGSAKGYQ